MAFYALDLETTGLGDPKPGDPRDCILELGVAHYSNRLELVAEKSWLVGNPETKDQFDRINRLGGIAHNMHQRSNLAYEWYTEYQAGTGMYQPMEIEDIAMRWFVNEGLIPGREPMVGSSISFDRERFLRPFMPRLNNLFHYRNIDASSEMETIKKLHRADYDRIREDLNNTYLGSHRPLDDIRDTINLIRAMHGMEPRYFIK